MALGVVPLLADFSYQETSKITGGMIVSMMKVAGVFSKEARKMGEPITSTVALKGDRLVHSSPAHTSIIDLANQTVTSIDHEKKTYSVVTFDEIRQAMQEMAEKMKQQQKGQAEVKYKVSVDNTGKTRQIQGYDAKEQIVKLQIEGTDEKSGGKGAMVTTIDSWVAPAIAGYDEVRDFYRRMGEKLAWSPGGNAFMNRPDLVQAMAEAQKETAKLEGMPVAQTIVMGAEGIVPPQSSGDTDAPKAQQQPPAERPSLGGAIAGGLGGRFGLGKKKPKEDTSTASSSSGSSSSVGSAAGVLMELTTEMTGFSSKSVDPGQLEVPAGFKKVDSEWKRRR